MKNKKHSNLDDSAKNEMTDDFIRDKCWKIFVDLKHKEQYYENLKIKSTRISSIINAFCTLTSLGSVISWGIWTQYPWLWAVIIAVSQVVSSLRNFFPYEKQLVSLKFLMPEISALLIELSQEWDREDIQGNLDLEKFFHFEKRFHDLETKYTASAHFPIYKDCDKKSKQNTINYMNYRYLLFSDNSKGD